MNLTDNKFLISQNILVDPKGPKGKYNLPVLPKSFSLKFSVLKAKKKYLFISWASFRNVCSVAIEDQAFQLL